MTRLRSLAVALLLMEVVIEVGGAAQRPAIAAPIVELKSHSRLQLDGVRRDGDMVIVSGRLYDPQTSLGLPNSSVELVVADIPVSTETDGDGRFAVAVSAPPGRQTIEMKFSGNSSLDEAALTEVADPELSPVTLTFEAKPTPTGVSLTVTAQAGTSLGSATFDAPLLLYVDRPGSDEMKEIAKATAGVPVALTRKQLGGAGTRRFRADFAGDASHQPATVTGLYELTSSSKTTLTLDDKDMAFEDTLTASGAITDEDGTGLAGAAVTLVAGDRRLAQGVSGPDGKYRFRVEGEILGVGTFGLQTLAEPGGAVQLSRSEPTTVKVSPPQPVPITYTVLAFLATGLAAAAFFLARTKPWKRFAKETPPSQQVVANAEAQQGGLVVNKPSLVSTLRRASDHGFSGAVRDTVRGRPVAGASVTVRKRSAGPATDAAPPSEPPLALDSTLVDQRDEHSALSGEDGTFTLEDLAPGDWLVSVSATSHITESFPILVPHRGELRGVRVDLVPVREKVFLLYQRAAMPVLPDPKLWGVWSPRQVVDHVRTTRQSPALAKLTDFVEEVYFSARPIEETVLPAARQRVDAAIAERSAAVS